MKQVIFRMITKEDTHFEHYDDLMIVIFYKIKCSNLNGYERRGAGKGQQTKKYANTNTTVCSLFLQTQ